MRSLGFAFFMLTAALPTAQAADAPAPPAPSGILRTTNRTEMLAIMQEAGMTALKDGTTDENAAWVEGKTANGILVDVYFYQCEPNTTGAQRPCGQLSFRAAWTNPRAIDTKAANVFNYSYVFGRAVVSADGGQVYHDYPLNLSGGVTRDFIAQNLNYFLLTLNDFIRVVNP